MRMRTRWRRRTRRWTEGRTTLITISRTGMRSTKKTIIWTRAGFIKLVASVFFDDGGGGKLDILLDT